MRSLTALLISMIFMSSPAFANGAPEKPAGAKKEAAAAKTAGKGGAVEVVTPVTGAGAEAVASPIGAGEAPQAATGMVTTSPMPPAIRKVSVLIESTPPNSDIEIDGVYVGSTPVQLSLKEGVHHVKISKEGFLPWARAVKAYHGLYVSPTLVSESTRSADVKESASAK